MEFGSDHYVPILKTKPGEKAALRRLRPSIRSRMTPLIEVHENKGVDTLKTFVEHAFRGLADCFKGGREFFLDPAAVAASRSDATDLVLNLATEHGLRFVPVTSISRSEREVDATIDYLERGLCLRVTAADVESRDVQSKIARFVSTHNLDPTKLHLLMDLGALVGRPEIVIRDMARDFLKAVPFQRDWRTFTFAGTNMVESMGGINANSHEFWPRKEWTVWKTLYEDRANMERLPAFGDYAVQNPKGVEGVDFRIQPIACAIRYTTEEEWLLIKGESNRKVSGRIQFKKLAKKLVTGPLHERFSGKDHCRGCDEAQAAASGAPGLGSSGAWRRPSTVHHLTVVAEQLAALTWP